MRIHAFQPQKWHFELESQLRVERPLVPAKVSKPRFEIVNVEKEATDPKAKIAFINNDPLEDSAFLKRRERRLNRRARYQANGPRLTFLNID